MLDRFNIVLWIIFSELYLESFEEKICEQGHQSETIEGEVDWLCHWDVREERLGRISVVEDIMNEYFTDNEACYDQSDMLPSVIDFLIK